MRLFGTRDTSRRLSVSDGSDFARVDTVSELLRTNADKPHRVIHHDCQRLTQATPQGMIRGVNVFGDGDAPLMCATPKSDTWMRAAFSFAIDGGVALPNTMVIATSDDKLLEPSIVNADFCGSLENVEPHVFTHSDGSLLAKWHANDLEEIDAIAVSPFSLAAHNYGHFLFDGLPLAYLLVNQVRPHCPVVKIITPALKPWQSEILNLLGLSENIVQLRKPTRFRTLVGNSLLSLHVSYTTRYARVIFDALKFAVPFDEAAPEKLFVPRPEKNNRVMRNLGTVKSLLLQRGYHVVSPEELSVQEQIRAFSRAKVIVGESGAAMANVCFAPPGAKLLEIMPECFLDQWMRSCCHLFGYRWHVFFAKVHKEDQADLVAGTRAHPGGIFSYDLNLSEFCAALDLVEAS